MAWSSFGRDLVYVRIEKLYITFQSKVITMQRRIKGEGISKVIPLDELKELVQSRRSTRGAPYSIEEHRKQMQQKIDKDLVIITEEFNKQVKDQKNDRGDFIEVSFPKGDCLVESDIEFERLMKKKGWNIERQFFSYEDCSTDHTIFMYRVKI